jgi:hypothetical protein
MARKARRRRSRRGGQGLNNLSTAALRAELDRRQSQVEGLVTRHRELSAELSKIESELDALGIAPGAGRAGRRGRGGRGAAKRGSGRRGPRSAGVPAGRKRHQNDSNLEEALAKVLKGKTMGVTEVAQAVQEAGYRTTSPNFRTIVNQALLRSELIKKVARGQYTAA